MSTVSVRTKDLSKTALDYAVAKAKGYDEIKVFAPNRPTDDGWVDVRFNPEPKAATARFDPSKNWAFAGPIIDATKMDVKWVGENWCRASIDWLDEKCFEAFGPNPITAAMRCFVEAKLGPTVEIPQSLAHQCEKPKSGLSL